MAQSRRCGQIRAAGQPNLLQACPISCGTTDKYRLAPSPVTDRISTPVSTVHQTVRPSAFAHRPRRSQCDNVATALIIIANDRASEPSPFCKDAKRMRRADRARQPRTCLISLCCHRHRRCTTQALVAIRLHCVALVEQSAMQRSRFGSTTKNRARHAATHDSCLSPQSAAPTQAAQLFADGWAVAICGITRTRRTIARLTAARKSSLVPPVPRSWRSLLARCGLLAPE